jgi:hypothetical protein
MLRSRVWIASPAEVARLLPKSGLDVRRQAWALIVER